MMNKEEHGQKKDRNVEIANAVTQNFELKYGQEVLSPVHLSSPALKNAIFQELYLFLSNLQLTKLEAGLLEKCFQHRHFLPSLAGTLKMEPQHDICNHEGFKVTGLTKIFFNDLNPAIWRNKAYKIPELVLFCFFRFFKFYPFSLSEDEIYATHEELKGDIQERRFKLASHFALLILTYATVDQLSLFLADYSKNRNNSDTLSGILAMDVKQNCFESPIKNPSPSWYDVLKKVVHKLERNKYALSLALQYSKPIYKLLHSSIDPQNMTKAGFEALLKDSVKHQCFIGIYILYKKKAYYLDVGNLNSACPLKLKRSDRQSYVELFPPKMDTVVEATSAHVEIIKKLPGQNREFALTDDITQRITFFLATPDKNRLSVLTSENEKLRQRLIKQYSDETEYQGPHY